MAFITIDENRDTLVSLVHAPTARSTEPCEAFFWFKFRIATTCAVELVFLLFVRVCHTEGTTVIYAPMERIQVGHTTFGSLLQCDFANPVFSDRNGRIAGHALVYPVGILMTVGPRVHGFYV